MHGSNRLRCAVATLACAWLAAAPRESSAQSVGATLRAKIRFESVPTGGTVTIYRGASVLRRATTPVSLVLTWDVDRPLDVAFAKRGYRECRQRLVVRKLGPTEGEVVQDTVRQQFPLGSMRAGDAPLIACTLRR